MHQAVLCALLMLLQGAQQHACLNKGPTVLTWCRNELVPAYVKLLKDTEAEVRVAAAGKVSAISKMLPPDHVIASIVPCVKDLAADSSQHVRSALASVVMEVTTVTACPITLLFFMALFTAGQSTKIALHPIFRLMRQGLMQISNNLIHRQA